MVFSSQWSQIIICSKSAWNFTVPFILFYRQYLTWSEVQILRHVFLFWHGRNGFDTQIQVLNHLT